MSENARGSTLTGPRARSEGARVSAQRYWSARQQVRSGNERPASRPRPLEFDESGFPIAQQRPSFAERVARLLG